MIILVEFGSSGDDFVTKADLKMVGGGAVFKGLWGWQGYAFKAMYFWEAILTGRGRAR